MFGEKEAEVEEGCGEEESSEVVTGLGFFQTSDTEERGRGGCTREVSGGLVGQGSEEG